MPASSIYSFLGKLNGKLLGTLGVFISASGYAENAPAAVTGGKSINVILRDRDHLDALFLMEEQFTKILSQKLRAAAGRGEVLVTVQPTISATRASDGCPLMVGFEIRSVSG